MKADLHTHTDESDGLLSPEELLKKAKGKGLDYLSITDHDSCAHVERNQAIAERLGIHYLPGIELSTLHQGRSVHILGYFRKENHAAPAMEDYYRYIREGREKRAKKFVTNLKEHFDIDITYERLLELSDGIIARPHLAKAIRELYPKYTHDEVFEKFLGEDSAAYVPSTELETEEGLALLRKHHVLSVLAHPTLLKKTVRDEVLTMPFEGIEAFYPLNEPGEGEHYERIAGAKGLIVTAGSDYHGITDDPSHGDLGGVVLADGRLEAFLAALKR